MAAAGGRLSPSGIWIADDFRSNLIIDRYDPVFADMRASKLKHLRSVNSEDAVTWNVFAHCAKSVLVHGYRVYGSTHSETRVLRSKRLSRIVEDRRTTAWVTSEW